jgi:hypothetical protein
MSNPRNKVMFTLRYLIFFADKHKIRVGETQQNTTQVNQILISHGIKFTGASIRSWNIPKFIPIFEMQIGDFDKRLVDFVERLNEKDKALVDHEINHENLPVKVLLMVSRN